MPMFHKPMSAKDKKVTSVSYPLISGRWHLNALAGPVSHAHGVVALVLHDEGIRIAPTIGDDVHDLLVTAQSGGMLGE